MSKVASGWGYANYLALLIQNRNVSVITADFLLGLRNKVIGAASKFACMLDAVKAILKSYCMS